MNIKIADLIEVSMSAAGVSRYALARRLEERGVCSMSTAYRFLGGGETVRLPVLEAIFEELGISVIEPGPDDAV